MSLQAKSFNLKTLIYIFLIMDLAVLLTWNWVIIIMLFSSQGSIVLGYYIGVRRENQFKMVMYELTCIAKNKKLTEEERAHQIIMGLHHWNLELGYIFEKLNIKYGFEFTKKPPYINNKKKTKKNKVIKLSKSEDFIKAILRFFGGLIIGLGLVWDDLMIMANLRLLWFIAFNIIYYFGSYLYFMYLEIYWSIKKDDIDPIPIVTANYMAGEVPYTVDNTTDDTT